MSRWIRNVQGMIGRQTWSLGILGFLALSSLAQADRLRYVAEGQFTSSAGGSTPLVLTGDTYTVRFTYDSDTANSTVTSTRYLQYPGAVVAGSVVFQREGVTTFTGQCDTASSSNRIVVLSGGYSPTTDDILIYVPFTGTSTGGVAASGYLRFRLSDDIGTLVPSDLSIPAPLPESGTWSVVPYVGGQVLYATADSVEREFAVAAWAYEAPITYIYSGTPLASVLQVGDVVSGTIVVVTSQSGSGTADTMEYAAPIILHEIVVTRAGDPIWTASQEIGSSLVKVETTAAAPNYQAIRYTSDLKLGGTTDDSALYQSWLSFYDRYGSDMLASADMPEALPTNWEVAYLMLAVDGGLNAVAPLNASAFTPLDVTASQIYLENLSECSDRIYGMNAQIETLDDQIASLQDELGAAVDDAAAKQDQIDTLTAQKTALEETLAQLSGTGFAAWKYEAVVTSVPVVSYGLQGIVQVGDIVTGNRILYTGLADTDPATGHALYQNTVFASDTTVTRNGTVIWQATHADRNSPVSLYLTAPQRVYFYDEQRLPTTAAGTADYNVVALFQDVTGSDLLTDESMPTQPLANWEQAYIYIRNLGGINLVVAQLQPDKLQPLSLADHITKRQELETELADTQQLVSDLQGTGYAAWKYQATVTSVLPGFGLDGIIQVGDTIAGNRTLLTEGTDTDSSTTHAFYNNMVLASDTVVTHAGTTVWQATHAGKTSPISLYPVAPQQVYFYDDQARVDDTSDAATYSVVVHFKDTANSDLLTGESVPVLPANWETAYVYIRVGGMTVVTAELALGNLLPLSLTDHVEKRQELETEITDLEDQVESFAGTGTAAWKYKAIVTDVVAGSSLDGTIQIGDTLTGVQVMDTTLPYTVLFEPIYVFSNPMLMGETTVSRNGETVWESVHTTGSSSVSFYMGTTHMGDLNDNQIVKGAGADSTVYKTRLSLRGPSGGVMWETLSIPVAPPRNWEQGTFYIRDTSGFNLVTAQLVADELEPVSASEHVAQELELQTEVADTQQLVSDLLGTGYAAWKFEAQITEVTAGAELDGTVRVGDTISGFRVMDATLTDSSPSTNEGIYTGLVRIAKTTVSRGGEPVWVADGKGMLSRLYLNLAYGSGQYGYLTNYQNRVDVEESGYYDVVFYFGSHDKGMLADDSLPAVPPANWDDAYVQIRKNGAILARADFAASSLSPMSVADLAKEGEELQAEATDAQQLVSDLVGSGAAAWKYSGRVTEVMAGSALDGIVSVNDLASGFLVMRTDIEDSDSSVERSSYQNAVVVAGFGVSRNGGDAVWTSEHTNASSSASIMTTSGPNQSGYIWDNQTRTDTPDDSRYAVVLYFTGESGEEVFPDNRFSALPPSNCTRAGIYVWLNGMIILRAEVALEDVKPMSVDDQADLAETKQAAILDLEQQLDTANADIAAKQAQIDALTADLATANADITAKQAQIDTLTAELATANADIAAKQAQIDALTADLATANADIAAKQAQIDTLTAELAVANADIVAKQAQIDTLTADLAEANAEIAARGAQIDALNTALNEANATIVDLTQTVSDLEAANTAYNAQVTSIADSMAALEAALAGEFDDPNFTIPGDTPEAKAANLKAAILSLNPGQRQALFTALGGDKNAK